MKIKPPKNTGEPAASHRVVSIRYDYTACEAAKSVGNNRYLMNDLPALPLSGCTSPKCNCVFVDHDDRANSDQERRVPNTLQSRVFGLAGDGDRRQRPRGRRRTDLS